MTSFTKESLSPRRVPTELVPLPFDLTWPEFVPALPRNPLPTDPELVSTRRFELQGLRGRDRSTLLTVECGPVTIDLFVKIASTSERDRYAFVERAGMPVPRLLVEAARGDSQVVLVFECLDTIGIDVSDQREVGELLHVVAQLNAVDAVAGVVPPLPGGRPEAEFTESVRRALDVVVDLGLRRNLQVEAWLAAYSSSKRRAASMPRALTHGEFYLQQVGRRSGGPLVILDLATVGWRPRFSDVCGVLAPLAAAVDATESEVFAHYVGELQGLGVAVPDPGEAFMELRWVRVLDGFQSLPWLTKSYDDPGLGLSHLEERLATLECDLVDLQAVPKRTST